MVSGGSWIAKPSATATPPIAEPVVITSSSSGRCSSTQPSERLKVPAVQTRSSCSREAVPARGFIARGRATAPSQQSPELNPYLRSSSQDDQRFVHVHGGTEKSMGGSCRRRTAAGPKRQTPDGW
jgi:hypothetical protein